MTERSNDGWIAALSSPGPEGEEALAELGDVLLRGLGYAFADGSVPQEDLEDFTQEALLKIVDKLDTFRAESKFLTWAHKIAVRVAYSELRRRRWRDLSLDALMEATAADPLPRTWVDDAAGPELRALQQAALTTLRRVIRQELTEKQRQALVATQVLGIPVEEVARRMGSNRNALYKLLHDARKRLKQRLAEAGMPAEEIVALF